MSAPPSEHGQKEGCRIGATEERGVVPVYGAGGKGSARRAMTARNKGLLAGPKAGLYRAQGEHYRRTLLVI